MSTWFGTARRSFQLFSLCIIALRTVSAQSNDGLKIYETTASTTVVLEGGGNSPLTDVGGSGSVTVGWSKAGLARSLSVLYTPSYYLARQGSFASANGLSQSLSLTATAKLRRKWYLNLGVAGQLLQSEQHLFAASSAGGIVQSSTSLQDLAGAVALGSQTNTAPNPAAMQQWPDSTLAIGNRSLNTTATAELSYRPTSRLSLSLQTGGTRVQTMPSDRPEPFHFASTSARAGVSLSYSLSPKTRVGTSVTREEIRTALHSTTSRYASAFLGRVIGRRLFFEMEGGAGHITQSRRLNTRPDAVQATGGGSLGYTWNAHTIFVSGMRGFADPYGLNATSTLTTSAGWQWHRPGRRWSVFASGAFQRLDRTELVPSDIWQANAGFTRSLNRQTDLSFTYAYGTRLSAIFTNPMAVDAYRMVRQHGIQMTVRFHPLWTVR